MLRNNNNTPIPRPAARILLIDSRDRLLLFRCISFNHEQPDFWITPGGALNPGETYEQAALRELWEETGLTDMELGPCVWTRSHVFQWDATVYEADERFYLVRTPQFIVAPAAFEPIEVLVMVEHRWWSLPEIIEAKDRETFVPWRLGELLSPIIAGRLPTPPIDTGP